VFLCVFVCDYPVSVETFCEPGAGLCVFPSCVRFPVLEFVAHLKCNTSSTTILLIIIDRL